MCIKLDRITEYITQDKISQKVDDEAERLGRELTEEESEDIIRREDFAGEILINRFNKRVGKNEIVDSIEEIISLLEVKLTNYQQNAVNAPIEEEKEDEVEGSGRVRKNMFLDLGPYQNKQKLIV